MGRERERDTSSGDKRTKEREGETEARAAIC